MQWKTTYHDATLQYLSKRDYQNGKSGLPSLCFRIQNHVVLEVEVQNMVSGLLQATLQGHILLLPDWI
jgi:hypothetical protein